MDIFEFVVMKSQYIRVLSVNWDKRKMVQKVFTKWKPKESSLSKLSKECKTLFKQLLISIIGLFVIKRKCEQTLVGLGLSYRQ